MCNKLLLEAGANENKQRCEFWLEKTIYILDLIEKLDSNKFMFDIYVIIYL